MKIRLFVLVFMISTVSAYSQNYEPLVLAEKIFSPKSMKNIKNYVTGEYKGRPNGKYLSKGITANFRLLNQDDSIAVVNMTLINKSDEGTDYYLHFVKQNSTWKMCAFRCLAMTGIIYEVIKELETMTPEQINEKVEEAKNAKDDDYVMFKSREDFDYELGNCKLTIAFDDTIINHFLKNQAEFERLKDLALKQLEIENSNSNRSIELIEDFKTDYRKLLIHYVSISWETGNGISFLIGGILDNTVGYLFVKDKKDLPMIHPDRIIMLREIGNGWYIYKTT